MCILDSMGPTGIKRLESSGWRVSACASLGWSSHLDFPQASRRERLGPPGQRGGARCTSRARSQLRSSCAPCSDEVSQLEIRSVQSDEAGSPLQSLCCDGAKMLPLKLLQVRVTNCSSGRLGSRHMSAWLLQYLGFFSVLRHDFDISVAGFSED